MDIYKTIFLSVFSGVLTSLIIYFFVIILNKIIIPWYQKLTYKGLDISGEWFEYHNYQDILDQESTIALKQTAHKIHGEIILVKKHKNGKVMGAKTFGFEGQFYDNFLNISCWNKNKRQLGTHNYLMTVTFDGSQMIGMKTWYDIAHNKKIISNEIHWTRKDSKPIEEN